MQHIALYIKGERDYAKITGSTGPLVYPGAHVWIYKQLYRITDEGRDVQRAQYIFALVYLGTLALVFQCYRKARVSILSQSNPLAKIDDDRSRHMSFRCWSYPNGFTVSFCCAVLMIASRCWVFLLRCSATSAINGTWAVSCSRRA